MPVFTALLRASPSLRRVLVLPYILLVIALALVIGLLSYQAGSRAVESVAAHLLVETVERIGQAVDHHMVGSAAVLEAAFPNDMPAPADISQAQQELTTRFWIATSLHIDPNYYVYYGNRLGQGFGLYRRSLDEGELRIKLAPGEHRQFYRLAGLAAKPELIRREDSLFDPRERPWYQVGMQTLQHTWTSVYIDFGSHDLVATRARSVRSAGGGFEGVVATDVPLKALNDFVRELKTSANGLAFIIEPDGALIASSSGHNLISDRYIGPQRLNAADDPSPVVRRAYAELRRHLNPAAFSQPPTQTFTFETPEGETMHAAFDWVRDDAGLAWVAVVAMPRSDFMGDLQHSALTTAIAASIAVVITLVLGLGLVSWVIGDIARLSSAATRIGKGQLNVRLNIDRQDEIGRLARALEDMYQELNSDRLTGLTSRAALMRHLRYAIRRHQQHGAGTPGFAVLFIDLNRFKAINDTYGHEAGDLALVEVAGRLREAVRQGDLVARLGGDEFVIVLWRVACGEVVTSIREKLERLLSAPLDSLQELAGTASITVGAAVGVALYPDDADDADSLLKQADQGMYADKRRRQTEVP